MPTFDDDDDFSSHRDPPAHPRRGDGRNTGNGGGRRNFGGRGGNGGGRGDSWDVEDDAPDQHDLVPDEYATVRCTHCKKLIFEETERCPYCKQMQLQDDRDRKPLWFIVTVILCVGLSGGFALLYMLGWLASH